MSLKEQIDQDLKTAMLAGDKEKVSTLRGIKSAVLYIEVAKGSREEGLGDAEVIEVLTKEAKKRQESADLFKQGGNQEKAEAELKEKELIQTYLPEQASEEQIREIAQKAIDDSGAQGMQAMGQVIGQVKKELGASADGATVAKVVKELLG